MSQFIGGTGSIMTGNMQATTLSENGWQPVANTRRRMLSYQRRGISQQRRLRYSRGLWPLGGQFMSGDTSSPLAIRGACSESGISSYNSPVVGKGNKALEFIMGRCVDANGTAVPGAVVQGFLTADDTLVRETACDDQGNYELGTEYPNVAHYLVAYLDTATDLAGTTVNTLIPTNRDGT